MPESASALKLESAYDALRDQCGALNLKLHETNIKFNSKVGELDVITYYLNNILSHMSQGLLFINLEGNITSCNSAAEALLDIKGRDILFQFFEDHFGDDFFGFSMQAALRTLQAPAKTHLTLEIAGQHRELEIESSFMLKGAAHGEHTPAIDSLQGLIILMRDVTEVQRLQELARRNDRMKELGEMAAMVAHEIRNPLGSIKGFASLLQRDLCGQSELERMAADIVQATDSLNHLVTNVLNYSRPLHPNTEAINLVLFLKELAHQVEADESLNPRIAITLKSTSETVMARADVCLLKSAVLNLIVNALQSMPEGGELTLEATELRGWPIIKVTDTGIGIPKENLGKLFSPFFTTKATGHGFGLAEVNRVIQAHAGMIEVKSEIGQGTCFIIKLPKERT